MPKGKPFANSERFSGEQLSQFRMVFNEGFDQVVLPVINELKDDLIEVKATQKGHSEILRQHSERFEDQGNSLRRIEQNVEAVTGYHDEEITRFLKHLKLKPLSTGK